MQENIEFHNIMTTNEFDMMYQKFLKQIHKACNASLKKKKSTYQPKITWWTQDLRRARNYTRALRRKTKLTIATEADFQKYRKQRACYKKAIIKAKRDAWLPFCANTKDPWGKTKKVAFQDFHYQQTYALANSTEKTQKN